MKITLKRRIGNYLSVLLPVFTLFLSWFNGLRFNLPYEYYIFELSVIGICTLVYLVVRVSQGKKFPARKLLWVVLGLFVYLFFSAVLSGNPDAGFPRIVPFYGALLFFLVLSDAFRGFLNYEIALRSMVFIVGFLAFVGLFTAGIEYFTWWENHGFDWVSPPFQYRIVGLMNSSNSLMGLINLFLPTAIVFFVRDKRVRSRVLVGLWLLTYIVVIGFSSSRGGYVGAAAGIGFFSILNFHRFGIVAWFGRQTKGKRAIWIAIIAIVIILLAILGYRFLLSTSSHPSHGGEAGQLNINRSALWGRYWNVFKNSPLLGTGAGRYLFGYFESNIVSPPGWLPPHAHSVLLGILVEFGIVGLVLVGILVVGIVLVIYRSYNALDDTQSMVASGVISGLISIAAHSLFDDFLIDPVFLFMSVLLGLSLFGVREVGVKKIRNLSIVWLFPLFFVVIGIRYLNLHPYQFLSRALVGSSSGEMSWTAAAQEVDRAVELAPGSHHYLSQAGFFWFNAWVESGDSEALLKSGEFFDAALEIEPGFSPMWVNRSLVSFYSGNSERAIDEINEAISLAPDEPVYYLNKARYFEEGGKAVQAVENYVIALKKSEKYGWATHPFFQQTEIRELAFMQWGGEPVVDQSFLNFMDAYSSGEIEEARIISARLNWESDLDLISGRKMANGFVLMDEKNYDDAARYVVDGYLFTYRPVRLLPLGWVSKWVYRTSGWEEAFLPGVLMLTADYGQLGTHEIVMEGLDGQVSTETLCRIEIRYRLAINGGVLILAPGTIPEECSPWLAEQIK